MSLFTHSNAATLDFELLNKQTVKITAGNEIGSGVLLCQKGDHVNILTAKHVFDSPYESIRVEFYRDYCYPVKLSKKELQIKSLKFITIGTSNNIKLGQEVTTTGHPIGESESEWVFQQGKVNRDIGEYVTHSSRITKGYSGGPLVNEQGKLIGINVVEEGNIAQAIPIDSILPFLRQNKIPIDLQAGKTEEIEVPVVKIQPPTSTLPPPPVPPQLDISGIWHDNLGTVFQITQRGNYFEFFSNNPVTGLSSWGRGTLEGQYFKTDFQTNLPSTGGGAGTISADGKQMAGTFYDTMLGQYQGMIVRP